MPSTSNSLHISTGTSTILLPRSSPSALGRSGTYAHSGSAAAPSTPAGSIEDGNTVAESSVTAAKPILGTVTYFVTSNTTSTSACVSSTSTSNAESIQTVAEATKLFSTEASTPPVPSSFNSGLGPNSSSSITEVISLTSFIESVEISATLFRSFSSGSPTALIPSSSTFVESVYSNQVFSTSTIILPSSNSESLKVTTSYIESFSQGTTAVAQFSVLTPYTTVVYTITSCQNTVTNCPARIGSLATDEISLYTTIRPVTPSSVSASTTKSLSIIESPSPLLKSTSTIYTTMTYTITSCHPNITNCPVSHVTTDTISVYTTNCPVGPTAKPTEPAYVIGILITIIIDITVEIIINPLNNGVEGMLFPAMFCAITNSHLRNYFDYRNSPNPDC